MASFSFHADEFGIANLSGSGLGFYGDGFGQSVNVGEYQTSTFITNSNGTVENAQVNNIRWLHANSGMVNETGGDLNLLAIPNYLATLNVRFSHGSNVQVQNVEARIYDRVSINNAASGVTTKMAELIHVSDVQGLTGSGDTAWATPAGSAIVVPLATSPGLSGHFAGNGANSTKSTTRHDWYIAISASPDSVGSKTLYGFYVECEYL